MGLEARRGLGAFVTVILIVGARAHAQGGAPTVERAVAAYREGSDPWLLADVLWREADPDRARRFLTAVDSEIAKPITDFLDDREPINEAAASLLQSRDPTSPSELLAAISALDPIGDPVQRARVKHLEGAALCRLGRPSEGLERFERSIDASAGIGWHRFAGRVARVGASTARRGHDFERALGFTRKRLESVQSLGRPVLVARALIDLGADLGSLGRFSEAVEALRRSERLARTAERADLVVKSLENRALVHNRRGEFERALRALESALEERALAKRMPGRGHAYLDMAANLECLGDFVGAAALQEKAVSEFEREGDDQGLARAWGEIGVRLLREGEELEALEKFEKVMKVFKDDSDPRHRTCLINMGLALGRSGRLKEGLGSLKKAVALARAAADDWALANALEHLGRVELSHDEKGAPRHLREAIDIADELGARRILEFAHRGLAEWHTGRGRHDDAVSAAREAVAQITEQVSGLSYRRGAVARMQHAKTFSIAISAAAASADAEAAFEFVEAGRAGSFMGSLASPADLWASQVPDELDERAAEASAAVSNATSRYIAATRKGDEGTIRGRLRDIVAARERLASAIRGIRESSRLASALVGPRSISASEIRSRLRESDVFVSYFVLDESVAAVVLDRSGARFVAMGSRDRVTALCRRFSPSNSEEITVGLMRSLQKELIAPLGLSGKVSRVLLSLDSVLFSVPVSVLFEDRIVTIVPSGAAFMLLDDREEAAGKGVLAIGAPSYDGRYRDLEAARAEIELVGTAIHKGKAATEAVFFRDAGRQRWQSLHLACHGVRDPERPIRTALALALSDGEDGLLTIREVLETRVDAELVVLSACRTARGEHLPGEGLVDLSRAFALAGASRVVSALWDVGDAATLEFMRHFYSALQGRGETVANAVRTARQKVRNTAKWRHPRHWAAWQLWGLPD